MSASRCGADARHQESCRHQSRRPRCAPLPCIPRPRLTSFAARASANGDAHDPEPCAERTASLGPRPRPALRPESLRGRRSGIVIAQTGRRRRSPHGYVLTPTRACAMPFMPFNILGIWFRGLLAIAILAGGIYLLARWYDHSHVDEYVQAPVATSDLSSDEVRRDEVRSPSITVAEPVRRSLPIPTPAGTELHWS